MSFLENLPTFQSGKHRIVDVLNKSPELRQRKSERKKNASERKHKVPRHLP
jgi:hypothetical protein